MSEIVDPVTLKVRQLQCKMVLQSGVFNQGNNTKIVNNLTIDAKVHTTLSSDFTNSADIIIYGMNESDIAALSTVGYAALKYNLNTIELFAQYEGDLQSSCFKGYIVRASCNFSDPSRPMHFECQTTYLDAIQNAEATSVNGSIKTEDAFSKYAASLKLSFQNNGVKGVIQNLLLTGSNIDQLKSLCEQANVDCVIDKGVLKITPKGMPLSNLILNINSKSGLIGYPTIDAWGVKLRIRYNPILQIGQYIQLQTIVPIPKSTGRWYVFDMQSDLNNRHENWYTDLRCSYDNQNYG